MIRIAEEFLFFFDKEIIRNYNVLPLAYTGGNLVVGTYNSDLKKIKKILKEFIPFELSMYKIKKEFFEEEYGKLFYKPESIIVYDKKKLVLPPGKMMIDKNSSEVEIIRYMITLMIKKKKKAINLFKGVNTIKEIKMFDFVYEKIKIFLKKSNEYNPLPFLIEGRKLFLYYEIQKDENIYLELLSETLWEKEIVNLLEYYDANKLIVIMGVDSIRKKLFLEFFIKRFKRHIFFTTRPLLKMQNINGFLFNPSLLDKYLYSLNDKKYDICLFDGNISLFTLFFKKRVKNKIVSLPIVDEKELTKKIKHEKIESAIKEAYDLDVVKIEFIGESGERFVGYKPVIKKYKKIV